MFPIVLVIAMFGHAAAALLYSHLVADEATRSVVYFGSKIVVNAIPILWVFGVERERFRVKPPTKRAIVHGLCSGVSIGVGIVAFYFFCFAGHVDVSGLRDRAGAYGAVNHFFLFAFFLCVFNSGLEEYYWRWFMFRKLRRSMNRPAAVALSAAGFTLHHIVVLAAYFPQPELVAVLCVGVFAGGCIWAMMYESLDNFFGPWISHFLVDAAIMIAAYDILFGL